jgi:hypothetical protein
VNVEDRRLELLTLTAFRTARNRASGAAVPIDSIHTEWAKWLDIIHTLC